MKYVGIGKHSRDEVINIAADDLRAISRYLGTKHYFLGFKPSRVPNFFRLFKGREFLVQLLSCAIFLLRIFLSVFLIALFERFYSVTRLAVNFVNWLQLMHFLGGCNTFRSSSPNCLCSI